MKTLTVNVKYACANDIVLPICFLGNLIVKFSNILFNTFILLWLTSFVDSGVLIDDSAAKAILQNTKIYLVLASCLLIRIFGDLSDNFPSHVTIPVIFLLKGIGILGFMFIQDP